MSTPTTLAPGEYEILAEAGPTDNCELGEATAPFAVSPKPLDSTFTIDPIPDQTYTGEAIEPEIVIRDGDTALVEGEDYEVSYAENIDVGTATVTIAGMGNYTGTLTTTFEIGKTLAPAIEWPEATQGIAYGQKVADIVLSAMADANGSFAWQNPDAIPGAGAQTATLVYTPNDTLKYDYSGVELTREIAIVVAPREVYALAVAPIPAQTYTGGPIYPAVSLWHGETKLVMGVDYTASYQNNVNVGVGIVTITGMGNCTGTRLLFFDIVPPQATEEEKPSGGNTGDSGETAESTGEAQQDRLVVDTTGAAMPYTDSTVEVLDEETSAVLARKLIIMADPVRDETGAVVLDADGQPRYEARYLLLSRELLDAIAERGYTHIRFVVKDAALEWPLASMPGDRYIVRLAPLETEEWSGRETAAIEGLTVLSQGYRAQIVTVENGEEIDVTKDILGLQALLLAEAVSLATENAEVNLLLVPLEEVVEISLSPAHWAEATEIEPARFEALLIDSGLFAMVGEQ